MDRNRSETNKEMQALIAKKATFKDGTDILKRAQEIITIAE